MIPILSNESMQNADKRGIEEFGIPSLALMESAGRAVADEAGRMLAGDNPGGLSGKRVFVLCGTGNNGGDGFVAARHLMNHGAEVWLRLVGERERIRGDALAMLKPLEQLRIAKGLRDSGRIEPLQDLEIDTLSYIRFDLVIDALFGTGLTGPLRGDALRAVDLIKRLRREKIPVLAVDIPSGLSGNNGEIAGDCAGADTTVTFAAPKLGHMFEPGRMLSGKLNIVDIGLPQEILESEATTFAASASDIRKIFPAIAPDAHKGNRGKLFILAGSIGLTGAAALCANGAVRSGAGLVVVGTPETAEATVAAKLLEAMTVALPDRDGKLVEQAARALPEWSEWADAWAIGPGLGRSEAVTALVRLIWENVELPMVVDADALNALADVRKVTGTLPVCRGKRVLTPHIGEFARLAGVEVEKVKSDRIRIAREFARQAGVVLVLKGAPTIIAAPDGKVCLNSTGNAALASGGSGDVLTGIIGALLARIHASGAVVDVFSAAVAATWIHGRIADRWIEAGNVPEAFYSECLLLGLTDVINEIC